MGRIEKLRDEVGKKAEALADATSDMKEKVDKVESKVEDIKKVIDTFKGDAKKRKEAENTAKPAVMVQDGKEEDKEKKEDGNPEDEVDKDQIIKDINKRAEKEKAGK